MNKIIRKEKFDRLIITNPKAVKVCVIGLGTVGLPTASCIKKHGFSVYGYDTDKQKIAKTNPINAFNNWSEVPECDIYVVCVSTGWKDGKPDMSNVFDACNNISRKGNNKPLVCIESTVSVGTCRRIARIFDEVYLVHAPHRFWCEEPEKHGVAQLRVIGTLNPESLIKATSFYKALKIPLYPVSSLELAEMTKIAENAYRFVQIAFVEQLRILCEKNGIPFEELRRSINTKWNVKLLEARYGIKGDCLPKDIRYLANLGEAPLLRGAIEADKKYVKYIRKRNNYL